MFEIREYPETHKDYKKAVYFRNKFLHLVCYDESDKVTSIDGYVDFDFERIAKMKAQDFLDNFSFQFDSHKKIYANVFDMFDIMRKGNVINISIYGSLDINSDNLDWLLWNPQKIVNAATLLAKKKGYGISKYAFKKDWEFNYLLFDFDFETKGTLGQLFNKAIALGKEIMYETEMKFLKQAMKKLKQ